MNGAIFDVDGTILDSMDIWVKATEKFFQENNLTASEEMIDTFKEMTLSESLPKIRDDNNLDMSVDDIFNWFMQYVEHEYEFNVPAKEGACEYIRLLHENGVKIALATSGYEHLCKKAFERLGIWQYIDACAFSAEVGVNKSNPDVYILAAERMGLAPADCTVFEDIPLGVQGAKKGGFKVCAVADSSNVNQRDALKAAADTYIESFSELI